MNVKENNNFVGLSLTPANTQKFPVLISKEYENNSTLNEVFVTFNMGEQKVLGKLVGPETINPFLDRNKAQEAFDFLKRFGPYKGLDGPDTSLATCNIFGIKAQDGSLMKLQNAPKSQVILNLATKSDLDYFFTENENNISFAHPRGVDDFLLPINPKDLFLHTDIVAKTGYGKTYLGALLAIALNGKEIEVFNKKLEKKQMKKIKIWILDVNGQIAEDDYSLFKELGDNVSRFIVEINDIKIESTYELVAAITKAYNFNRMPFQQKIEQVIDTLSISFENLGKDYWTYPRFEVLLRQSINESYNEQKRAEWIIEKTMKRFDLIHAEKIWEKNIEPRLKAPWDIENLCVKAEQGDMIVFDLKNANPIEKPIFAEILLKKLYNKAQIEYNDSRTEYGFATLVFIDEVQDYCPQREPEWYERECKPLIIDIAKKGRKFGLGLVLMTQRYASVSKEALTQMNTYFTGLVDYGDKLSVKENQGILSDELNALRKFEFYLSGLASPVDRIVIKGVDARNVQQIRK